MPITGPMPFLFSLLFWPLRPAVGDGGRRQAVAVGGGGRRWTVAVELGVGGIILPNRPNVDRHINNLYIEKYLIIVILPASIYLTYSETDEYFSKIYHGRRNV